MTIQERADELFSRPIKALQIIEYIDKFTATVSYRVAAHIHDRWVFHSDKLFISKQECEDYVSEERTRIERK